MRATQVNACSIGHVFNIFPESLFLVADDGSVDIPDNEGNLDVNDMDASHLWTCDGDSLKPAAESGPSSSGSQFAYQPPDDSSSRIEKRKRN